MCASTLLIDLQYILRPFELNLPPNYKINNTKFQYCRQPTIKFSDVWTVQHVCVPVQADNSVKE